MGAGGNEGRTFGRAGVVLGCVLIALVAGLTSWSALAATPVPAQKPTVFGGSLVLGDTRPMTVIDVATGQVTVRLEGIDAAVGAANYGEVQPVAVQGGTFLVDRVTGTFNFLGADDYVDDPRGAGVSLGPLPHSPGALGVAAGDAAFVMRSGPASTVSLVGPGTVEAAAHSTGPVTPLGSADVPGVLDLAPGGSAVAGRVLWALYGTSSGCRAVTLTPVATSRQGLVSASGGATDEPCATGALESDTSAVGWAQPGRVELFGPRGGTTRIATPFTSKVSHLIPVEGAVGQLWWLAGDSAGWSLFGVSPSGRVAGPFRLTDWSPATRPAVPALSGGVLYTLDRMQSPEPILWTVELANGHMAPLAGEHRYPVRNASERDDFRGVEVLLDGPRVVYNNPGSLEAVVVFSDGSRPPLAVDKSTAVAVSATGPADLQAPETRSAPGHPAPRPPAGGRPPTVPVVAPVSQEVTCAKTTQKPYAPQITALTPSPQTVLVRWSYQLLDQTDCEPDSWSVQVLALGGSDQPAQSTALVTGQEEYVFSGLHPTTTYQVVVTAYINAQSTPSTPATFVTLARGPDAPLTVTTTADGHGGWDVAWTPCTAPSHPDCVVPASKWTVVGDSCAGSFVGTPPSIDVPGGTTSAVVNADQLGILGDALSFHVQGSLPSGLTGDPTSDHACTEAWEVPSASDVQVSGSGTAAPDDTITATVVAAASGNLAALLSAHPGGVQFVYRLAGETFGPTDLTRAVFSGLPAGSSFTPQVTVYATGHPTASVTVAGPAFSQTLDWPNEKADAIAHVDGDDPNTGRVTVALPDDTPAAVTVTGPPGSAAGPMLQCGGVGGADNPVSVSPVTRHSFTFVMGDLIDTGGACALRFTLTDTATPDPYGVPSPPIEADFDIGTVPDYHFHQGYAPDCSDDPRVGNQCGPGGQPWQLVVAMDGAPVGALAGGDWAITTVVGAPGGQGAAPDLCASTTSLDPPAFPYTLTLPAGCLPQEMDRVDVSVSYTYLGQVNAVDAGYPDNKQGPDVPVVTTTTSTTTPTSSTTTPASTTTTTPTTTTTTASAPGAP